MSIEQKRWKIKLTKEDIRKGLKAIRNYYIYKKSLNDAEQYLGDLYFINRVNLYNTIIKFCTPRLYLLYKNLYIDDFTQELYADKTCYSVEYISKMNQNLVEFFL